MLQFTECDFFTNYNPEHLEDADSPQELALVKENSYHSHSTLHEEEGSDDNSDNTSQSTSKRTFPTNSSENHNMVKQLIITIKQMMGRYVEDIGCSFNSRQIISATWKVFEKTKSPNKEILKAMFDKQINKKIIEKVGMSHILSQFGTYEFQSAMEELRLEILLRMRGENLKSHMFNRALSKKDRLAAYVQYFIEEQLKKGKISARFNEAANKRMKQILLSHKQQDESIDCYFQDSIEVSVRFTSTQATY